MSTIESPVKDSGFIYLIVKEPSQNDLTHWEAVQSPEECKTMEELTRAQIKAVSEALHRLQTEYPRPKYHIRIVRAGTLSEAIKIMKTWC